jgi:hypothetical protein
MGIKLRSEMQEHVVDSFPLFWYREEFLPALTALGRYFRLLHVEVVKVEKTLLRIAHPRFGLIPTSIGANGTIAEKRSGTERASSTMLFKVD